MKENDFKRKCRYHQSWFRSEVLKVGYDDYVNILQDEDGQRGLNFYDGFDIFNTVKENLKNKFQKPLFCNLLRSEHIPYNLFVPLDRDKEFGKQVFNEILGDEIDKILKIKIEYPPKPKQKYLNDNTSFDTYIEYLHKDGLSGIIGIEVKYTELSYKIGITEKERMEDTDSLYYQVSKKSDVFNDRDLKELVQDDLRQIWRNHLLGESILLVGKPKFSHFHSLTFYPLGNTHFTKVIPEYQEFLKPECRDRVQGVTYERFFEICRELLIKQEYGKWLEYLEKRYIPLS